MEDVQAGIEKGALEPHSKLETIRSGQGKTLRVGGSTFRGKRNLSKSDLLTTAIGAYNSGLWAYYDLSMFGNPDRHTTGRDYSTDTLRRARVFRRLL